MAFFNENSQKLSENDSLQLVLLFLKSRNIETFFEGIEKNDDIIKVQFRSVDAHSVMAFPEELSKLLKVKNSCFIDPEKEILYIKLNDAQK